MIYEVDYWVHMGAIYEVEANSREEAEQKFQDMLDIGEVEMEDLDFGDDGFEVL